MEISREGVFVAVQFQQRKSVKMGKKKFVTTSPSVTLTVYHSQNPKNISFSVVSSTDSSADLSGPITVIKQLKNGNHYSLLNNATQVMTQHLMYGAVNLPSLHSAVLCSNAIHSGLTGSYVPREPLPRQQKPKIDRDELSAGKVY